MDLRAVIGMCLSIALVAGCSKPAQGAAAEDPVVTPYMSVKRPTGEWKLYASSDDAVTFTRGGDGDSYVASIMLFGMGPANTPEEYEALIRKGAANDVDPKDPGRYELLEQSIKYSNERPYPCVRYKAASMDKGAHGTVGPQVLELAGLYCRHPMDASVGAAIMYSHRGTTRHADLGAEAQTFIENAVLPGPK